MNATYFIFQNNFYKQKFGKTIRSPVSVTVMNLVVKEVEERVLTSDHMKTPIWKRYVEDTFIVVSQELIKDFHKHINSVERTIMFAKEVDAGGKIVSLDVLIYISKGENGVIMTEVYRKPTHTGQYLNYHCYCLPEIHGSHRNSIV